MISTEAFLYNEIIKLRPEIEVTNRPLAVPTRFPAVCAVELANSVYERSQDESVENHANIMWQVDIWDNDISVGRSNCIEVAQKVDAIFSRHNFTRCFYDFIETGTPNTRLVLRYKAVVASDGRVYRR